MFHTIIGISIIIKNIKSIVDIHFNTICWNYHDIGKILIYRTALVNTLEYTELLNGLIFVWKLDTLFYSIQKAVSEHLW